MHKVQTKHKVQNYQNTKTTSERVWVLSRLSFVFCLFFVMFVFWALPAKQAWADPHAVYYTATAQEQLFFNVLAALNQADYVELSGLNAGQTRPIDREALVRQRDVAPLPAESEALLERTETGLSGLISRLITLEGNDLYSDQLIRGLGAESARRNSTSELLRSLCDYSLGFEDCDFDTSGLSPEEIAAVQARRNEAVVVDPLEFASRPFTDGVLGAFLSGTPEDTKIREELLSGKRAAAPRAYSPIIAAWRRDINKRFPEGQRQVQHDLLDQLLTEVASSWTQDEAGETPKYPYADFNFVDGIPELTYAEEYLNGPSSGSELSEIPFSVRSLQTLRDVQRASSTATAIGEAAAERIRQQWEFLEKDGLLADFDLKLTPDQLGSVATGTGTNAAVGELSALVNNPVGVRRGIVDSLPVILGMIDTSQLVGSPQGLNQPGNVELVDRGDTPCPEGQVPLPGSTAGECTFPPGDGGDVRGLSDNTGQVLGVLRGLNSTDAFDYDLRKDPVEISANIIQPHLEQGIVHALRNLTAGQFRRGSEPAECGWTCQK